MWVVSRIAEPVTPGYELAPATGGAPNPAEGQKSKRKQTLLSLLDALQELSKDGDLDIPSTCPLVAHS